MENLVFTELVKKGKEPNRDIFYYRTKNDKEIDFIIKDGIEITELIQVCYDISSKETEKRENQALIEAGKELQVKKLTILTWNENKEFKKEDTVITITPLAPLEP